MARRLLQPKYWSLVGLAVLAVITLVVVGVAVVSDPKPPSATGAVASFEPAPVDLTDKRQSGLFIGDSWVGGSNMGGNGWHNFSNVLAAKMGWRWAASAVGGSGYVKPTEPLGTYSDDRRIKDVAQLQPDYTFVVNGINDWQRTFTDQELAEAAGATYDKILAAAPRTKLIVIGMMAPGQPTAATIRARDAIRPEVEARGGLFIDPVTDPWWVGENMKYVGSDNYHLTDEGHVYLAKKVEDIIRPALNLPTPAPTSTPTPSS